MLNKVFKSLWIEKFLNNLKFIGYVLEKLQKYEIKMKRVMAKH